MEKGRKLKEVSLESQWTQGGTALTVAHIQQTFMVAPRAKRLQRSEGRLIHGVSHVD